MDIRHDLMGRPASVEMSNLVFHRKKTFMLISSSSVFVGNRAHWIKRISSTEP